MILFILFILLLVLYFELKPNTNSVSVIFGGLIIAPISYYLQFGEIINYPEILVLEKSFVITQIILLMSIGGLIFFVKNKEKTENLALLRNILILLLICNIKIQNLQLLSLSYFLFRGLINLDERWVKWVAVPFPLMILFHIFYLQGFENNVMNYLYLALFAFMMVYSFLSKNICTLVLSLFVTQFSYNLGLINEIVSIVLISLFSLMVFMEMFERIIPTESFSKYGPIEAIAKFKKENVNKINAKVMLREMEENHLKAFEFKVDKSKLVRLSSDYKYFVIALLTGLIAILN